MIEAMTQRLLRELPNNLCSCPNWNSESRTCSSLEPHLRLINEMARNGDLEGSAKFMQEHCLAHSQKTIDGRIPICPARIFAVALKLGIPMILVSEIVLIKNIGAV